MSRAGGLLKRVGHRLNRLYYGFVHHRVGQYDYNRGGVAVFERDWDNCYILDACRYDTFADRHSLPGDLQRVQSRASTTRQWLRANLRDRDLSDTVYVTATPTVHECEFDPGFHAVVDLWEDHWDAVGTVRPGPVTAAAIDAHERYPDKRLLVHYLQPHYPFVGPTGQEAFDYSRAGPHEPLEEGFWETVGTDVRGVPREMVRTAYRENVDIVCEHVADLFEAIPGRSVVTADHGEMLYDRAFPVPYREVGHPGGYYTRELVEVPWLTHQRGERREVVAERPESDAAAVDAETVTERLSDLGYR